MKQSSAADAGAAKPKVLILGATGGTGRHVVSQALARGYDVAVLARSAEKARHLVGTEIVIGDALDEAALRRALKGRDAVISALGTPASPFPRGDASLVCDTGPRRRDEGGEGFAPGGDHRARSR